MRGALPAIAVSAVALGGIPGEAAASAQPDPCSAGASQPQAADPELAAPRNDDACTCPPDTANPEDPGSPVAPTSPADPSAPGTPASPAAIAPDPAPAETGQPAAPVDQAPGDPACQKQPADSTGPQ